MNLDEYVEQAMRTECNQSESRWRFHAGESVNVDLTPVRVTHAVIGLTGEVGELASTLERWIYYGRDLDVANIEEELGDCMWYIAQLCSALGLKLGTILDQNIAKLASRYPDKFDAARRFRTPSADMTGPEYDPKEYE